MKTIKPFRLTTLPRPYSWRGRNFLSVAVFALADLKDPAAPKLLSDIELWREVLPDLDCDGVIDHVLPKAVPEYLIGGYAYTRHQEDKRQVIVRAEIGGLEKDLLVFGDRHWIDNQPTDPAPFEKMPVAWSRAYGGKDYAENPTGQGIRAGPASAQGPTPLPNIESPVDRYQYGRQQNKPYGFGPVNMLYPRRFRHIGSYSEKWKIEEFPGFFPDMNPLIFNAAEPDQRWEALAALPLGAGFSIWNMHPGLPCWSGQLPEWHARAFIRQKAGGDEYREIDMRATTAWFVPHQERLLLIYHGNTEIQEDDASDVASLMSALEADGDTRDFAHYRSMMQAREDPNEAALHVLCDEELITASILGPINIDIEAVYQTPTWIKSQNYKNKIISEQRQFIAESGQDPNEYLPEECGPHKKYTPQDLSLLAAETARLDDEAKDIKRDMEKTRAEQKALYASENFSTPDTDKARVAGPPKALFDFTDNPAQMQDVVDIKTGEVDFARLADMGDDPDFKAIAKKTQAPGNYAEFIEKNPELQRSMDWMQDPAFQRKMRAMRPLVHKSYLIAAHTQDAPDKLDREQNEAARARVAEACRRRAPLGGMDLTGADLSNMHFQGMDARCALLESTDLSGCKFIDCDLSEAVLARAELAGAVFSGCNLEEANLSALTAVGASFENCRLTSNIVENTTFEACRFRQITLESWMPDKITFARCQIADSDLSMSILNEASLVESRLDGVRLAKVSFQNSTLDKTVFDESSLDGCSFFISRLSNTYFHASQISNSAFMHQTQLVDCSFESSRLKNCNFRETPMASIDFGHARMEMCDFSLADMRHANFRNCCSNGSMYIRSVLNHANFNNANCIGSDFKAADLRQANMAAANLFRANFALSKLDGSTLLDDAYTKESNTYPKRKSA